MKYPVLLLSLIAISILLSSPVAAYQRRSEQNKIEQNKREAPADINWEGEYLFWESGGKDTGMVIEYSINFYKKDGGLVADIDADGFQTQQRLACNAKTSGRRIDLFFESYRKENLFEIFKPGELLLSLEAIKGKTLTYWAAIKPQLVPYKNGRVYFVRRVRRGVVGALRDLSILNDCGCNLVYKNNPKDFVFITDDGKNEGWMNIDGKDVEIKLISYTNIKEFKIGNGFTSLYEADGAKIRVVFTITGLCPPDDPECARTVYKATITVSKGRRRQIIEAKGMCGCP